jgi:hypothetical protein
VNQKLIEMKAEIYKSTVTVGDFNTPFTVIDRTRQKIFKDIEEFNTINQLDLTDIYRILHPITAHSFSSATKQNQDKPNPWSENYTISL